MTGISISAYGASAVEAGLCLVAGQSRQSPEGAGEMAPFARAGSCAPDCARPSAPDRQRYRARNWGRAYTMDTVHGAAAPVSRGAFRLADGQRQSGKFQSLAELAGASPRAFLWRWCSGPAASWPPSCAPPARRFGTARGTALRAARAHGAGRRAQSGKRHPPACAWCRRRGRARQATPTGGRILKAAKKKAPAAKKTAAKKPAAKKPAQRKRP